MAQSSSAAHQIANRYASALLDTAQDAKAIDSVTSDMADLSRMLVASTDLQKLVSSPAYGAEEQEKALLGLAKSASFHTLSVNFLKVLVSNRRLSALKIILAAFEAEVSRRRGEIRAQVRSATPLSDAQQKELRAQLKTSLGHDVQLDLSVDQSLIGGLVVTVGSRQVDDSIKNKLERLKQTLTTSNQNNVLKEVG